MTTEEILHEAMRHETLLMGYAYALLRNWALAQDAVQEAVVAVATKPHAYSGAKGNVLGWLRGIVRHKAIDIIRARRATDYLPDEELSALIERRFAAALDEDTVGHLARQHEALRHCLGRLRPDLLALLLGFYRDRLSCDALAAQSHRSVNAVRLSLSRLRQQLRDCARQRLAKPEPAA